MPIQPFADVAVLYHSPADGGWVAHSLRTDQVGTGDDMVRALADLIRGVNGLLAEAAADPTVAYLREAPADIPALAAGSVRLPAEVGQVARKIAGDTWPESIDPRFVPVAAAAAFTADLPRAA